MSIKKRKKRIQEVSIGSKVPGTGVIAMQYWEHIFSTQDTTGEGMGIVEDPLANPDVLEDQGSMYSRPLTVEGELMMQAVHETIAKLSPQQQAILQLTFDGVWSEELGQRVHTEQAIADFLKISRSTVQTLMRRVKTKIRRRYEILKTTRA